jgi:hypothetical protein
VNFCCGTINSVVQQSHFRNTGDDALASWAETVGPPNANNTFQFNTVQTNWRAHCAAIYGGFDNTIEDMMCSDTADDGGIEIEENFTSYPFTGTTTVQRNTLLRTGTPSLGNESGGLQVDAVQSAISGVLIQNTTIQNSIGTGILIRGPFEISNLTFNSVQDIDAGMQGILVDDNANGSATITNLVVTSPGGVVLDNVAGHAWTFNGHIVIGTGGP